MKIGSDWRSRGSGREGNLETRKQKLEVGNEALLGHGLLIFDSYLQFEVQEWYLSLRNYLNDPRRGMN